MAVKRNYYHLTQINWNFIKVLDSFQYPYKGYKCLKNLRDFSRQGNKTKKGITSQLLVIP